MLTFFFYSYHKCTVNIVLLRCFMACSIVILVHPRPPNTTNPSCLPYSYEGMLIHVTLTILHTWYIPL